MKWFFWKIFALLLSVGWLGQPFPILGERGIQSLILWYIHQRTLLAKLADTFPNFFLFKIIFLHYQVNLLRLFIQKKKPKNLLRLCGWFDICNYWRKIKYIGVAFILWNHSNAVDNFSSLDNIVNFTSMHPPPNKVSFHYEIVYELLRFFNLINDFFYATDWGSKFCPQRLKHLSICQREQYYDLLILII